MEEENKPHVSVRKIHNLAFRKYVENYVLTKSMKPITLKSEQQDYLADDVSGKGFDLS